ncbi:sodium:solute symporter family protein [Herbaspirillum sp. AP02]|uniref:sodium:solute symporter family protein n=1 Tax=unclassified Herbaspirillum TaxID=2624150 RepID=UPI0015DB1C1C|nr:MULTISPECIES: sodium:solute symporter family protein [unclassified Herbaspirillum]MBG7621671.1 sodium:solute symporter family protein [Herbaspirillum sp. AP02]NZD67051.1 sodium:solute symporter family protein [Herbaspirillum sp. AP21]
MNQFGALDTAIIIAMVVVYIVATSWLSIRLRSKTTGEFMVAGRAAPVVVIAILLMSEFIGAKSTIGTSQEAFNVGIAASWSVLAAAIGFLLFGLFMAKRLYKSGEFTISGFVAQKYGKTAKLVVSAVMIYALLIVNVGNYVSGAAAISTVLKVNLPTAAVITAIVSTIYFAYGGLKSVLYVTIFHSAMKIFGIGILVWVALSLTGGIAPMVNTMPEHYFTWKGALNGGTIGAWVIGTSGAIFSTQFIIQAISGARSGEDARKATLVAAALCVPIALALGLLGVAAKFLFPEIKGLYALPVFLQHMHPVLSGVVTVSLVASIFVSVSTVALAIASLIVKDFYVPRFKPSPERELVAIRWISLVVGFVPLIFVLFVPQILALSFFTRALRLTVTVVALMGIYLPFFNSSRGAISALVLATVATTVWYLLDNPFGIDNMYIALVAPAIVMVIERLIFPAAPTATEHATAHPTTPELAAGSRQQH